MPRINDVQAKFADAVVRAVADAMHALIDEGPGTGGDPYPAIVVAAQIVRGGANALESVQYRCDDLDPDLPASPPPGNNDPTEIARQALAEVMATPGVAEVMAAIKRERNSHALGRLVEAEARARKSGAAPDIVAALNERIKAGLLE